MANQLSGTIVANGVGFVRATLDGIEFDKIKTYSQSTVLAKSAMSGYDKAVWKANGSTDGWKGSVNAVDIDWNEGIVPNGDLANGTSKTIKTTGDLLSLINTMQQEIYVLSAAVVALANK